MVRDEPGSSLCEVARSFLRWWGEEEEAKTEKISRPSLVTTRCTWGRSTLSGLPRYGLTHFITFLRVNYTISKLISKQPYYPPLAGSMIITFTPIVI